jgi:SAM-dependent methyltransferase
MVLDLSCGYGRNLEFLQSLGLEVCATEITEHFVVQLQSAFPSIEFSVGTCQSLPFENEYLDGVVACNSCYYLDETASFLENLTEIFRVLKPGGFFLGSMVASRHSLIVGQRVCSNGTVTISGEDLNRRNSSTVFENGQRIQTFANSDDLQITLNDFATDIRIGSIEEKLGDTNRHLWYFACTKRGM